MQRLNRVTSQHKNETILNEERSNVNKKKWNVAENQDERKCRIKNQYKNEAISNEERRNVERNK